MRTLNLDDHKETILRSLGAAHAKYYEKEKFGGPSLYFHIESLKASRKRDFTRFVDCACATLASWGMHRMGSGGSKMRDFDEFSSSIAAIWNLALELQERAPSQLSDQDWHLLEGIFKGIRCMRTGTSLVGNSKVLAHLLPELVPPVDREYTLKFLYGSKQITNNIDAEWQQLRIILQGFFYPLTRNESFLQRADVWLADNQRYKWDTSHLKIADNLIIGYASGEL